MNSIFASRSCIELTVEQVEGKGGEALYIIHIATNHHAFTLKRSRTVRRMKDFKFLQSAMKGMHPYANLPGKSYLTPFPLVIENKYIDIQV